MEHINPFDRLPLELVAYVLGFLEGSDLKVAELSCQMFRGLISGPNCIPQVHVRKYLWILPSAPQGTFQEQCVWANGALKRIFQFVKMGFAI